MTRLAHGAAAPAADGGPAPGASATGTSAKQPPIWPSRTLLGTGSLAYITHQGETYRLQLTRQGKLILTK